MKNLRFPATADGAAPRAGLHLTDRLVPLDDRRALDPLTVGAKAARLAQARAAGLPALPGVVVPVKEARPAFVPALEALERGGSGEARLAAMAVAADGELLTELAARVRQLGPPVIVRSSSPLEAGGHWAGAFSSFDGIALEDLSTALRGCWASAFSVHALECAEAAGVRPADVRLAVLVQPQVTLRWGGTAHLREDGSVDVTGTRGSPQALLSGWVPGARVSVAADGTVSGDGALDERIAGAAAALARAVADRLGDDLIEWGWTDDAAVLLQARRAATRTATEPPAVPPGLGSAIARRVALLAERFGGPPGDELVLPWAVALAQLPDSGAAPPSSDLGETRALAALLVQDVWQGDDPSATLAELRGPDPQPALERIARLDAVGPGRAARVLATVERFTGCDGAARRGPGRWEPFVYGVVAAQGRRHQGVAASPGVAAGRLRMIANPHDPPPGRPREVLAAVRPVPALAPLLWNAAALVTSAGSPGAHLLEVANSLGVPAVVSADVRFAELEGALAAVDGNSGRVTVLPTA